MPSLGTFISGPYTATYNGQNIGIVEAGFELELIIAAQEITGDAYGDTIIDGVYRGGNMFVTFVGQEQLKGALLSAWPFSATAAASYALADLAVLGVIGKQFTEIGQNIVLTAIAGTTAATNPATLTAMAFPSRESKRIAFKSGLRQFPCRMQLILQDYSGTKKFFSVT